MIDLDIINKIKDYNMYISEGIKQILDKNTREDVCLTLEVSSAVISKWLREEDAHIPRFNTAIRIYGNYDIVTYPYSEEALKREWEKQAKD